jgi:hypothetical protein
MRDTLSVGLNQQQPRVNCLFYLLLSLLIGSCLHIFFCDSYTHHLHFVHDSQDVISQYLSVHREVWPYSQSVKYSVVFSLLQNRVALRLTLNLCAQILNYVRMQTFPDVFWEMHVPVADRYSARLSKLTATIRSLTQDTLCDGTAILLRLDRSHRKNQQDATV